MRILYLPNCWSQQRQKEKKRWIYPILLAMQAEWYRRHGHRVYWNEPCQEPDKVVTSPEPLDFLSLPAPDRIWTNEKDKRYQRNGNFKYHPGAYIQVADGCWWGRCSFCVEKGREWKIRDPWHVIQELKEITRLGYKEVFDDSGTFPTEEKWLGQFMLSLKEIPREVRPRFGCNMRLVDVDYSAFSREGFRMMLFGIESANQETLDRINKGRRCEDVKYLEEAARAGIECHGAVMFGYPWETDEDAYRTLRLVQGLLKRGVLKTAQASYYCPPEGGGNETQRRFVRKIYDVAFSPQFWMNKIRDVKNFDDFRYLLRQVRAGLGI